MLVVAAGFAAVSQALPGGFLVGLLTALVWIVAPFIALGIGIGDAFFVQYGSGRRRVLLTVVFAVLVAIGACVALDFITEPSQNRSRDIVGALFHAYLYAAVVLGLSGAFALGIGLGTDYASRRIDELSQDDW